MRNITAIILMMLCTTTLQAQENWWITKTVKKVGTFLDTMAVSGVLPLDYPLRHRQKCRSHSLHE